MAKKLLGSALTEIECPKHTTRQQHQNVNRIVRMPVFAILRGYLNLDI